MIKKKSDAVTDQIQGVDKYKITNLTQYCEQNQANILSDLKINKNV